jgi:uncharacterized phage protein (TIGR01671 family)
MRDYKFRGKRLDNGEWVYGPCFANEFKAWILVEVCFQSKPNDFNGPAEYDADVEWFEVDPATVGQYTGLKDKNGVEIYEGDLTHAKGSKTIFRIEFVDGSFCLVPHHSHSKESVKLWSTDDGKVKIMPLHLMMSTGGMGNCEVIGNIYENPELLK